MLDQENLPALLSALGFQKKGSVYRKVIGSATLEVNFAKKEICYPETAGLRIHERQACNFHQPENFVVLECVHRLLEKGYKPEHIELEPRWKTRLRLRRYGLRRLTKMLSSFFSLAFGLLHITSLFLSHWDARPIVSSLRPSTNSTLLTV